MLGSLVEGGLLHTATYVAVLFAVLVAVWFILTSSLRVPLIKVPLTALESDTRAVVPGLEVVPDMPLIKNGQLQCYDPATAQLLGTAENMTAARVEEVVARAKAAQPAWAKTTFAQRRRVMRLLLKYFLEHADAICRVSVRDSGKTTMGAVLGEIVPTVEKLRWMIAEGEKILAPSKRGGHGLLTVHKVARVELCPLGVLGVLAPFNYPCHNMFNHVISGLFSGNAVVCKPSEHTSWSGDYFLRIVRAALAEGGHSPDLVQVVTGVAEAGAALCASKNINKVIFTGSDRVGRHVMRACADNLTPVVLELGGKDPFVVCGGVDLARVVPIALRGVFQNCGQNCIGVERVFVEASIADAFIAKVMEAVREMKQKVPLAAAEAGECVDLGALCMPAQLDTIDALVQDAVKHGATLLHGGKRNTALAPGLFYEPTVLTGITPDMRIAQEEVFGPVMAIQVFSSDGELLEKANNCPFGLGSSVFCEDRARALRIVEGLHAGMANINDFGINYLVQSLPFGGVKNSGFGRFAGPEGLRACCYEKSITEDLSSLARTTIPRPLSYPTSKNSSELAKSLVGLAYGDGIIAKCRGLFDLLRGLGSATYE